MSEKVSKLVFESPTSKTPGYLRRAKAGLEFKMKLAQGISPAVIDEIVNFLLDYITEPVNREEAKEMLYDVSEEKYNEMIDALTGDNNKEENPTAAETPLVSSEPLEKAEKDSKENSQNGSGG